MKNVLFLRNVNASWAIRDREILKTNFDVEDNFVNISFYLNPIWLLKILKSEIVFCWFASFTFYPCVLIAKILNKKIIIVSGGFDAAFAPAIGYGAFTKSACSRMLRKWLFGMADKVLCVSKANMAETIINAQVDAKKCEMIYHGFEKLAGNISVVPWHKRANKIVMICQCDHTTYYRKGIDNFLKIAMAMPDYQFTLIGKVSSSLEVFFNQQAPGNFKYTGFLNFQGKEFLEILNNSKFALQLSRYESFGCAIVDAAIMGCYPISTSNFSLYEVVEGIGSVIPEEDIFYLKDLIENIQDVDSVEISNNFLERFSFKKREKSLNKIVTEI